MTKAFKKGQEVTYIADWDRKGSVFYQHAIVYSCGKKQMVLTHAVTGEEMGRHFKPELGSLTGKEEGHALHMPGGTFPRMTDAEAEAAALVIGARIVELQRQHFEKLKLGYWSCNPAVMDKELDALHEPRAVRR